MSSTLALGLAWSKGSCLIVQSDPLFNLRFGSLFHVCTGSTQSYLKEIAHPFFLGRAEQCKANNANPFPGLSIREAFSLSKPCYCKQSEIAHLVTFQETCLNGESALSSQPCAHPSHGFSDVKELLQCYYIPYGKQAEF